MVHPAGAAIVAHLKWASPASFPFLPQVGIPRICPLPSIGVIIVQLAPSPWVCVLWRVHAARSDSPHVFYPSCTSSYLTCPCGGMHLRPHPALNYGLQTSWTKVPPYSSSCAICLALRGIARLLPDPPTHYPKHQHTLQTTSLSEEHITPYSSP